MKARQIFQIVLAVFVITSASVFAEGDNKNTETSPNPLISKIVVEIEDARGDGEKWTNIAESLIFLREGEPFSQDLIQQSLDALKLSRKFQNIHVDTDDGEENITLFFRLKPFRYVTDIQIDEASPFFERDILNVMTIYIGDAFVRDELPKQQEVIEKLFREDGFIAPRVTVTAQESPEHGNFIIFINIRRGDYHKVGRLEIEGNKSMSSYRLKLRMKTWTASLLPGGAGRLIEKNLRQDIKNLTEYYRKKGYPDVRIDFETENDPATNKTAVLVKINEGSEYDVEFRGNEEFWDMTLKDDLVLFKEGNKKDRGIRKSVRNIKTRYKNAGYPKVKVSVGDEKDEGKSLRKLSFVIEEGPRSIVESIQISGNHVFDEKKIKKQMLTQEPGIIADGEFVPKVIDDDVNAITGLYFAQGYRNTEIRKNVKQSDEKRKASVDLEIEEGVQTLVSSVKTEGISVLSEKEISEAIRIKEGQPFLENVISEDQKSLASLISEKGYPHIKIKGDFSINEDQTGAAVLYTVDEGPYTEMGDVHLSGNFRTKNRIILNELEIKPRAPFSLVKLLESQRNIRNLNIFDSVQFKTAGLKEKGERIHLFVETEEKRPYFVQVGLGYDTARKFYGNAVSGDRNLFGTNKSARLEGEISQIGYSGGAKITEPRLFGTRYSTTLEFFVSREEELNQDFGIRSFGSSLGFSRKWSKHLTTSLGFRFEQRSQFRPDSSESELSDVYDSDEFETRRFFVTTPSVSYDTRDSFVRPRKGFFSSASLDISQGLENSVDNFLKYELDGRFYWTPVNRLTLAWHGWIGHIEPTGSAEKVPDDHLFFLGGISDIRGFGENMLRFDVGNDPVGGHIATLGSMEARVDLGFNFELTTFYDMGTLSDVFGEEISSKEFRSSVGAGLRYITPIGPIGFLYGLKLDREEEESGGRLHFSLGYTF